LGFLGVWQNLYKQGFFSKPNSTCSRAAYRLIVLFMPSVLWRCWLGGKMGIRSAKTEWWGAGVVICLERGANLHIRPSWCYCHSLSLASVKSRLVLPFWYRLNPGGPGKRAVKWLYVCVLFMTVGVFSDVLSETRDWEVPVWWQVLPTQRHGVRRPVPRLAALLR